MQIAIKPTSSWRQRGGRTFICAIISYLKREPECASNLPLKVRSFPAASYQPSLIPPRAPTRRFHLPSNNRTNGIRKRRESLLQTVRIDFFLASCFSFSGILFISMMQTNSLVTCDFYPRCFTSTWCDPSSNCQCTRAPKTFSAQHLVHPRRTESGREHEKL